ncbi:hypothetical protein Tco_1236011 [Tanacetum coccineum]
MAKGKDKSFVISKLKDEDVIVKDTTDEDTTDEDIEESFFPKSEGQWLYDVGFKQNVSAPTSIHGAVVSIEDANSEFLRALPSSWNNIALIMRKKTDDTIFQVKVIPQLDDKDLEQLDQDNLKCNDQEIKWNRNEDAGYRSKDNTRRTVPVETSDVLVVQDNALILQDGFGYDWSYIAQDEPTGV